MGQQKTVFLSIGLSLIVTLIGAILHLRPVSYTHLDVYKRQEQHSPYHKYDVWEHTVNAVSECIDKENVKLAMFFHDIAKPELSLIHILHLLSDASIFSMLFLCEAIIFRAIFCKGQLIVCLLYTSLLFMYG